MKPYFSTILIVLFLTNCRNKENTVTPDFTIKPAIPSVLLTEHQYLLEKLEKVTFYKDSTGNAARRLYEIMEYHFNEEEDYAFPPLGILPGLSRSQFPEEREKIIMLSEKFRKHQAVMLAEHQMISHYLHQMMRAAEREGHQELKGFDSELEKHAALEEEVLFPTVLMIGDYLQQKSKEE